MRKMKQGMAVVLTATMVLGSAFTVLADDTPATSGGTSGAGTSEGHVDKEVVNMVLPTVAAGTSPFAYTMDPERLIQETEGAKYEDFTFPAKDSDTGVYFLTGDKTYANTSNTLQAVNKSSCDVTLTVKVKATASAGGKDITLATSSTPSTTASELYLGLKVGSGTQVVSGTEATVAKTVAGTPTNFATTVKDKEGSSTGEKVYAYEEKADATTWKAINISMTGAVSEKAITADTTAPTVDVTWSYAKAADGASVDTADQTDYSAGPSVVFTNAGAITVSSLASGQTVTGVNIAYTKDGSQQTEDLLNNQNVTWNEAKTSGTMNSNWTDYLSGCGSVTLTVTFSGNVTKTATATF